MNTDRILPEALTFDDVLLAPAYSEVLPRETILAGRFSRNVPLDIPVASAAMDTVTEAPMAEAMAAMGGIGVIHKNMSIEAQASQVASVSAKGYKVAAGVGITADALERVEALVKAGVSAVVLDSAHGHSKGVLDKLREIKASFPTLDVVVGNVATAEAVRDLIKAGADGIKVGIGPGSICTTRIVAGVGVPQLSTILACSQAAEGSGVPVIADGGLRYSGDIVKALAAGAECVMCGSMLSGTLQAPGDTIEGEDGRLYKAYRGMGSTDAMQNGSADRYFQKDAAPKKLVPEGVVARVAYKGDVNDVVYQILGGLRSGMGYCGARTIADLHTARFVRITASGMAESHPHEVTITKESPNYHCK